MAHEGFYPGVCRETRRMKWIFPVFTVLEGGIIFLISIGWLEREAAFFVTAALALWLSLRPIEEGLPIFVISIPFFAALPISDSFDQMASWRVLLAILFARYLVEEWVSRSGRFGMVPYVFSMIRRVIASRLGLAAVIFLGWALISALAAPYPAAGIKKVIFLGQLFTLYPITVWCWQHSKKRGAIETAIAWSVGMAVIVGFGQVLSLFVVTMDAFWRFWAGRVIPALYGYNLGELLQTSNTWFSYSGDGAPTLRIFSLFPDSHSFAMFLMLGLSIPAARWISQSSVKESKRLDRWFFFAAAILLALVLSGSRGVWASALVLAGLLTVLLIWLRHIRDTAGQAMRLAGTATAHLLIIFGVFAALFVPAAILSAATQRAQGSHVDTFASFKRAKSITDLEEISNRSRLQIWKEALGAVRRKPLLGIGTGNFAVTLGEDISASRRGASAHNLYLDIASEMGIPGIAGFAVLISIVIWRLLRSLVNEPADGSYAARTAVLLVFIIWVLGYSFFDVVLFNDKVLMLGTVLAGLGVSRI